ncbi:MAG: alkene reductase [Verrucomicrobiota bacterium JB023]|nr:alkene reductase [Verrucomicrobiota bacterium JB023]
MDKIFEPLQSGPLSYSNRIVMAPMTRARAGEDRVPNEMMMEYYNIRSNAGLIITEATHISEQGIGWSQTPGIHTKEQVEGWKKITDAVHLSGGRIFLQLWHTGRASHSSFNGMQPVSSSPVAKADDDPVFTDEGKKAPEVPRALSVDEIKKTVDDYRHASECAFQAGFDGVEIHAANGYLIDQFLRDGVNQRDDQYGGSIENRLRFLLEVLEAVKSVWAPQRIGVRFSPTNPFNSMSDSDPRALFTAAAKALNSHDLAYLHLLEARPGVDHQMAADDAPYIAPDIRKVFNGLLMLNAGYSYETGNRAIEEGEADLIAYGVPFLANPDLVQRFATKSPLNEPDQSTFYTHGEQGYLDYPMFEVAEA